VKHLNPVVVRDGYIYLIVSDTGEIGLCVFNTASSPDSLARVRLDRGELSFVIAALVEAQRNLP